MNPVPLMDTALAALWRASWQASVIVLLVLAAQWVCGRGLAPQWRYALWFLVVARLLLPATPQSAWSVFNLQSSPALANAELARGEFARSGEVTNRAAAAFPRSTEPAVHAPAFVSPGIPDASTPAAPLPQASGRQVRARLQAALARVQEHAGWLWFLGVLALGMRLAWGNYLFALQLRRRQRVTDPAMLQLLDECRMKLGLNAAPELIEVPELDSPALFGCFRLKLLLPEGLIARFSADELRHVFLHELAHVRRGDPAINWLTTVLLTLHWLNPVLWFAFHRMRADREVACDALALASARDGETSPYGRTVIKVLEGFATPTAIPGLVGILEDKHQMKRRITMIAQFGKPSPWPALAAGLLIALGLGCLTDAKREPSSAAAVRKGSSSPQAAVGARTAYAGQLLIQKTAADTMGRWVASPDSRPSPDGHHMAYVNWQDGNLAVADMRTGALRNLTTEGTWTQPDQWAWRSVWSPDGRQIAYVWYKGDHCDLRVVEVTGEQSRVLVPFAKGGNIVPEHWSKDGQFIIGMAPVKSWAEGENRFLQIVRVTVATGEVKVIKELPGARPEVNLALSPDGRHVAYDFPSGQLHVVSIDGTQGHRLIDHPAKHLDPLWTPDGKHLVFRSDRSGEEELWVVAMRDGVAQGEPIMVRAGFMESALLGFTDDGTLHYLARTPRINVFVADVDFEAATMGTPQLVSRRNDGRNRNPRWSADGREMVFVSRQRPDTDVANLVYRDAGSGNERIIESKAMNDFQELPRWSPDLSKIVGKAFSRSGAGHGGFYIVDVKTGQRTKHLEGEVGSGNLTRDGNTLVYREHLTENKKHVGAALIEYDLRTLQKRLITRRDDPGFNNVMQLSPDEEKLAYLEAPYSPGKEHPATVMSTSRKDGATEPVWQAPAAGRVTILDWLPDSRRLLVRVDEGKGQHQLHLVDTATKTARAFGPPLPANDPIQNLSIHPDGKRVAFSRGDVVDEIWTMKNLVAEAAVAAR